MKGGAPENPVSGLFSRIAGVYDLLNHVLSLGIDRGWRKELAEMARPQGDGALLDIAAGTLDVAIKLADTYSADVYALDFCLPMLARGSRKLRKRNLSRRIFPACGDALALPYPANAFESVTIAFGIRNIPNRKRAFSEMARVLKPGGKLCVLEFGGGRERIWGGLYNFYLDRILPRIGEIVGHDKSAYSYLAETIGNFPPPSELENEIQGVGFKNTGWKKLTSGIVNLHWGKKPDGNAN